MGQRGVLVTSFRGFFDHKRPFYPPELDTAGLREAADWSKMSALGPPCACQPQSPQEGLYWSPQHSRQSLVYSSCGLQTPKSFQGNSGVLRESPPSPWYDQSVQVSPLASSLPSLPVPVPTPIPAGLMRTHCLCWNRPRCGKTRPELRFLDAASGQVFIVWVQKCWH